MRWWSELTRRDRQLLGITVVISALLIVVVAVFGPARNQGTVPSTFSNSLKGARAAYLLLEREGYHVVRSIAPLSDVAGKAAPGNTYIFADPFLNQTMDARKAVKEILARGGRVLVTGVSGAMLLPGKKSGASISTFRANCNARPTGLSPMASSGNISIEEEAGWKVSNPEQEVVYRCGKDPVVVTFPLMKGTVVWWASASPLENGTIERAGNLALLLNSIGPRKTTNVVWDESLHGAAPSLWSRAAGTALPYMWWQFGLVALLLVFSMSRRSGPLRPDPVVMRAAPLEFARSLGGLYEKAGATNVAVSVAYQNFRMRLEKAAGIGMQASPDEAAAIALRRYPQKAGLAELIQTAAGALEEDGISRGSALKLVQALRDAEQKLT